MADEHWSDGFTLSMECPAGMHPQWAVDHEDTTTCPSCALDAERAKVAGLREYRSQLLDWLRDPEWERDHAFTSHLADILDGTARGSRTGRPALDAGAAL